MAALSTIATLAGVAAIAGGTVYNAVESSNARDQANKQAEDMRNQQEQALFQQQKQWETEQKKADDLRRQQEEQRNQQKKESDLANATGASNTNKELAQTRQRKLAMQGQSYRDTILTGPLGIPSNSASTPNSARKTLLGM